MTVYKVCWINADSTHEDFELFTTEELARAFVQELEYAALNLKTRFFRAPQIQEVPVRSR